MEQQTQGKPEDKYGPMVHCILKEQKVPIIDIYTFNSSIHLGMTQCLWKHVKPHLLAIR